MHGLIHTVWKSYIEERHGREVWAQALQDCGVQDDAEFLEFKQHEDKLTHQVMSASIRAAGSSLEASLELFGAFFVQFMVRQGWTQWLQAMGSSLEEFVQNLNDMHHVLERDFRSACFPVFTASRSEEGEFFLTYSSSRFVPSLTKGVLREVAAVLYNVHVELLKTGGDGKTEITWKVVQSSLQSPSVASRQPTSALAGFSWFDVHKVLAAACRGTDVFGASCCRQEAEGAEVVIAAREQVDTKDCDARSRRPSDCQTSFSYSTLDEDVDVTRTTTLQDPDSLPSVAKIRQRFQIPTISSVLQWLGRQDADRRLELARMLQRAVPAGRVACHWYELSSCTDAEYTSFWKPQLKSEEFYLWSESCRSQVSQPEEPSTVRPLLGHSVVMWCTQGLADDASDCEIPLRFVSHSWWPPQDWHQVMGEKCSYEAIKAAELCIAAKDLSAEYLRDASRWEEARFWIDKCCIRQNDEEFMSLSIQLIEEFMQLCHGMVVIFTWSYLERLWCVYEWACFLVFHEPHDMVICAESLYRVGTEERFLESVRRFSVEQSQCTDPEDRKVLEQKIKEYYGCCENFERFLRVSVIAIIGRCLAARGARSKTGLCNWVALADDLGFQDLADGLRLADPAAWRQQALDEVETSNTDLQSCIKAQSDAWFADHITPILAAERRRAVQRNVFRSMLLRKNFVRKTLSDTSFKRPTAFHSSRVLGVRQLASAPATVS
mmetsp:Transcript_46062/g.107707  ORF Transcript_46062/g.107707 Transcript_46062/m.107707 type:complete len:719 (-) Transcript_46062:227-2383(-)